MFRGNAAGLSRWMELAPAGRHIAEISEAEPGACAEVPTERRDCSFSPSGSEPRPGESPLIQEPPQIQDAALNHQRAPRRAPMLCSQSSHHRTARGIEALLEMPVCVEWGQHRNQDPLAAGSNPLSLKALLESLVKVVRLQRALILDKGQGENTSDCSQMPSSSVFLKGSLAAAAVVGDDLCSLLEQGRDLDLFLDASDWCSDHDSRDEGGRLSRDVVLVWVYHLLEGIGPEQAWREYQSGRYPTHFSALWSRFFCNRYLRCCTEPEQEGQKPELWSLYTICLQLPGGRRGYLDLTVLFHSSRPFLTDDAAFEIRLPVGGDSLTVASWVKPEQGLQRLRGLEFAIPDLASVRAGALEKVLSKQSAGLRCSWGGERSAQQRALLNHFAASRDQANADGEARHGDKRLCALPQKEWSVHRHRLYWLQIAQVFPALPIPEEQLSMDVWPQTLQPIASFLIEVEGELRARLLRLLAPFLSDLFHRQGMAPLPVWGEVDEELVRLWVLPSPEEAAAVAAARNMLRALRISGAHESAPAELLPVWWQMRHFSADQDQDARLLLALLEHAEVSLQEGSLMAMELCMELSHSTAVVPLLRRWPGLARIAESDPGLSAAAMRHLSSAERRSRWVQTLAKAPIGTLWLTGMHDTGLDPLAQYRACWNALIGACARREPLPRLLAERALELVPSGERSPSQGVIEHIVLTLELQPAHRLRAVELMTSTLLYPGPPQERSRTARCWIKLMASHDVALPLETVDALFKGLDQGVWLGSGPSLEAALLEALERLEPRTEDLPRWVQAFQRWSKDHPERMRAFPASAVGRIPTSHARGLLEGWARLELWSPAAQQLLARALEDPRSAPDISSRALEQGWPLGQQERWWAVAQLITGMPAERLKEGIILLEQQLSSVNEPPPAQAADLLCSWLKTHAALWAKGGRLAGEKSPAFHIWRLAERWRNQWGSDAPGQHLLAAVVEGSWQVFQAGASGSKSPSRSNSFYRGWPLQQAVESRKWIAAAFKLLHDNSVSLPGIENLTLEHWLEVASHLPEELGQFFVRPGAIRDAFMQRSVQERRQLWTCILRHRADFGGQGGARHQDRVDLLIQIAQSTQMLDGLDQAPPPATVEWIMIWSELVDEVRNAGLLAGWLSLAYRSFLEGMSRSPNAWIPVGGSLLTFSLDLLCIAGGWEKVHAWNKTWLWEVVETTTRLLQQSGMRLDVSTLEDRQALIEVLGNDLVNENEQAGTVARRAIIFGEGALLIALLRASTLLRSRSPQEQIAGAERLAAAAQSGLPVERTSGCPPQIAQKAVTSVVRHILGLFETSALEEVQKGEFWRFILKLLSRMPLITAPVKTVETLQEVQKKALCAIEEAFHQASPLEGSSQQIDKGSRDQDTEASDCIDLMRCNREELVSFRLGGGSLAGADPVLAAPVGSPGTESASETFGALRSRMAHGDLALLLSCLDTCNTLLCVAVGDSGHQGEVVMRLRKLSAMCCGHPAVGSVPTLQAALYSISATSWKMRSHQPSELELEEECVMTQELESLIRDPSVMLSIARRHVYEGLRALLTARGALRRAAAAITNGSAQSPEVKQWLLIKCWAALEGQVELGPDLRDLLSEARWQDPDGAITQVVESFGCSYIGFANLAMKTTELHGTWRQLESESLALPLDRLLMEVSEVVLAAPEGGLSVLLHLFAHLLESGRSHPHGSGSEIAFGLLLRGVTRSLAALSDTLVHSQGADSSPNSREARQLLNRVLMELLRFEENASDQVPRLLLSLINEALRNLQHFRNQTNTDPESVERQALTERLCLFCSFLPHTQDFRLGVSAIQRLQECLDAVTMQECLSAQHQLNEVMIQLEQKLLELHERICARVKSGMSAADPSSRLNDAIMYCLAGAEVSALSLDRPLQRTLVCRMMKLLLSLRSATPAAADTVEASLRPFRVEIKDWIRRIDPSKETRWEGWAAGLEAIAEIPDPEIQMVVSECYFQRPQHLTAGRRQDWKRILSPMFQRHEQTILQMETWAQQIRHRSTSKR